MGQSAVYRMPVPELVASRMASTVFLFVYGVVLARILMLALAVTTARNRGH
mgnify:FL=1